MELKKTVTVVKFGANWCVPCKTVDKVLAKISQDKDFADVAFETVDVDDSPDQAKNYKIRTVPTVILFKGEREDTRISGVFKPEALKKSLRDILKALKEKAA